MAIDDSDTRIEGLLSAWDEVEPQSCILIADDHDHIRRAVRFHLEKAGYKVEEACNGRETLEAMKYRRVELVLLDVMMPGMDGFEICRHIRNTPSLCDTPVLMLTALNRKSDVIQAIQAGANGYVLKPFKRLELVKKVKETLEKAAMAVSSSQPERRAAFRKPVKLTLSWCSEGDKGVIYKTRVLNLSLLGLCFEAPRCEPCLGYEQGTIHPKCSLFQYAVGQADGPELELLLSLPDTRILPLNGRVAHIYQPPQFPDAEHVGVAFCGLDDAKRERLRSLSAE